MVFEIINTMASVAIHRPALHNIIHKYSILKSSTSVDDQEWKSEDETEDEDSYSVYSDEYLTQEEYSEEEAEEEFEYQSQKRYTVNLCTRSPKRQRRTF